MDAKADSDRFIPLPLARVIAETRDSIPEPQRASFESFTRLLVALLRYEISTELDELKALYDPFNPDLDTIARAEAHEGTDEAHTELRNQVRALVRRANFVELSRADLDAALTKTSPLGLAVSVDLDSFDDFCVFYRGRGETVEWRRTWKSRFRKAPVRAPVYRRVFLLIKARPDEAGENTGPERELGELDPRHVVLKLFKDIPHSDLEMLLPNTRVRMKKFDKVALGLTGGGGTIGGVVATASKVGAAAAPSTWVFAIAGLVGVLWRQLSRVFAKRTKYMATLAKRLYFASLDNNLGVLTRLVESALEEEVKEALLAYAELLRSEGALSREELDRRIEARLQQSCGRTVDFDVQDGLAKLERQGLLVEETDGLRAVALDQARGRLDSTWDSLFGSCDGKT